MACIGEPEEGSRSTDSSRIKKQVKRAKISDYMIRINGT